MTDLTTRALAIAATLEHHDAAMASLEGEGRAPWRTVEATAKYFPSIRRHYVTCIPVDHACWSGNDMIAWSRLGIWTSDGVTEPEFADGICALRNSAPEVAAVLRRLAGEVEVMRGVVEASLAYRDAMDRCASDEECGQLCKAWDDAVDAYRAKRGTP